MIFHEPHRDHTNTIPARLFLGASQQVLWVQKKRKLAITITFVAAHKKRILSPCWTKLLVAWMHQHYAMISIWETDNCGTDLMHPKPSCTPRQKISQVEKQRSKIKLYLWLQRQQLVCTVLLNEVGSTAVNGAPLSSHPPSLNIIFTGLPLYWNSQGL